MSSTLILGGARSGKSRRALTLANNGDRPRIFMATAEALDEEMATRIATHKTERDSSWETLEVPIELAAAIKGVESGSVVLVDCLTLWLSNLMHQERDISAETERLCIAVAEARCDLILVSNEVGLGLVPESPLGREFRDEQGRLNQSLGRVCSEVEFVAAGLPLKLKSS